MDQANSIRPPKVFLILPFQRVAGRTKAQGETTIVPAWATDRPSIALYPLQTPTKRLGGPSPALQAS